LRLSCRSVLRVRRRDSGVRRSASAGGPRATRSAAACQDVHRHAPTDKQWARLARVLPPRKSGPESSLGNRLFIEAVLFRATPGRTRTSSYRRCGSGARSRWSIPSQSASTSIDATGSCIGSAIRLSASFMSSSAHATRYEKTARNHVALVQLGCACLWLGPCQARHAGGRERLGRDVRRRSASAASGCQPTTEEVMAAPCADLHLRSRRSRPGASPQQPSTALPSLLSSRRELGRAPQMESRPRRLIWRRAQRAASATLGSGAEARRASSGRLSRAPSEPSTRQALRRRP